MAASSGAKVEQVYIPTPDASKTWKDYQKYYQKGFSDPHSYIRQSETVEECTGCPYNMDEEDETFLKTLNTGKTPSNQCSEDEFEMIMNNYETTIADKQPFLTMDPAQVMSFEELAPIMIHDIKSAESDTTNPELLLNGLSTAQNNKKKKSKLTSFKQFGQAIYAHWRKRKIERKGQSISPTLKTEDNNKDDSDPYVCFRRRELRQVRKTRRTDTQSSEKLRRLRIELQAAKYLMKLVVDRERLRMEALQQDHDIFEARVKMKDLKRKLNISGDDEDLVTLKKRKNNQGISLSASGPNAATASVDTAVFSASVDQTSGQEQPELADSVFQAVKAGGNAQQAARAKPIAGVPGAPVLNATGMPVSAQALSQQQQQQISQQSFLHPYHQVPAYVRLPSCKIPDIELMSLDHVLRDKENAIKAAVKEKIRTRQANDKDWINYTDNPFVPYCDYFDPDDTSRNALSILQPSQAAYSSIATTYPSPPNKFLKFPLSSSLGSSYSLRLEINSYLLKTKLSEDGNLDIVSKTIDREGPWPSGGTNIPRGTALSLRRRVGRGGRTIVDRRGVVRRPKFIDTIYDYDPQKTPLVDNELSKWTEALTFTENSIDGDSERSETLSRLERLDDRYKYDSDIRFDSTEYPGRDPSRLNGISEETQAIRFGSMLMTKAYDIYWEAYKSRQQQLSIMHKQLQQKKQQAQQQVQTQPQTQIQTQPTNQTQNVTRLNPQQLQQQSRPQSSQNSFLQQNMQRQVPQNTNHNVLQQQLHQQTTARSPSVTQVQIQQQQLKAQMKAKLTQHYQLSRSQSPTNSPINGSLELNGSIPQSASVVTANSRTQTQTPPIYQQQTGSNASSPQIPQGVGINSQLSSPSISYANNSTTANIVSGAFSPHGRVQSPNQTPRGSVSAGPSPTLANAGRRLTHGNIQTAGQQVQTSPQQQSASLLGLQINGMNNAAVAAAAASNPALQAQLQLLAQQQQRAAVAAATASANHQRTGSPQNSGLLMNGYVNGLNHKTGSTIGLNGADLTTNGLGVGFADSLNGAILTSQQMKSSPKMGLANASGISPTISQQALYQQLQQQQQQLLSSRSSPSTPTTPNAVITDLTGVNGAMRTGNGYSPNNSGITGANMIANIRLQQPQQALYQKQLQQQLQQQQIAAAAAAAASQTQMNGSSVELNGKHWVG